MKTQHRAFRMNDADWGNLKEVAERVVPDSALSPAQSIGSRVAPMLRMIARGELVVFPA
jgi:hypothetical protein